MSKEDIFTLFVEDYRRRGVVLRGYKRFDMEILPDAESIFSAEYLSGAILRIPLRVRAFILPSSQDVNISHAKTGSLELELSGSGSGISVFLKTQSCVEFAYSNYYPPCKWCATVVQTIEMLRGDELIVYSKSAEILSVAVYGWTFAEDDIGVKTDEEEADKEKIIDKQKSFWKSLQCLYKELRKQ